MWITAVHIMQFAEQRIRFWQKEYWNFRLGAVFGLKIFMGWTIQVSG